MNPLLLAQTNPPGTETGATEFLANLSVGMVVLIALALTVVRLAMLNPLQAAAPGRAPNASGMARSIAEVLESLIIALVLVFLIIRPFFVQAFFIPSASMEKTLLGHDAGTDAGDGTQYADSVHDHIFVNKLIYHFSEPQHGDIIVFRAPKNADMESERLGRPQVENVLIKRLIGLPGDTIEVKDGKVVRNGKVLDEPDQETEDQTGKHIEAPYHINQPMQFIQPGQAIHGVDRDGIAHPLKLGPSQLFVMGDNRNNSNDSRYWGVLDKDRVIGKAWVIFFPLNRLRVLH